MSSSSSLNPTVSPEERLRRTPTTRVVVHEPSPGAWWLSFGAAMVPFVTFCYGHSRGWTVRVVNAVVKSPLGPAGLLLLPFCTLAMEKSIYDTVQAAQGLDPTTRPVDRGGFPSGGAEALPSLSLLPVQRWNKSE